MQAISLALSVAAMLLVGSASPLPAQVRPAGTTRTDLQRQDLGIPGREALQARVDFAPASSFPRDTHPGEEIIYVLEGSLEYEVAGKIVALKAGDVLFVPARTVHAARNTGTTKAAELATYVLEKGKPLTTIVD